MLCLNIMQFEPSRETVGVISMLLNATTPFFLDDDPPDTEPPDLPTTKKRGRVWSIANTLLLIDAH